MSTEKQSSINSMESLPAEAAPRFPAGIYAAISIALILGACWLTSTSRSWSPFVLLCVFLLAGSLVSGSASALSAWRKGRESKDAFVPFHIVVVVVAVCGLLMGVAGVLERPLWFGMNSVPSMIVKKWYDTSYSANDHRQFKLACESRNAGPMEIRRSGDRVYVRCGLLFPATYTISAPTAQFTRAVNETDKDPPGMPVYFDPPT